jgi:hypothetical protein
MQINNQPSIQKPKKQQKNNKKSNWKINNANFLHCRTNDAIPALAKAG